MINNLKLPFLLIFIYIINVISLNISYPIYLIGFVFYIWTKTAKNKYFILWPISMLVVIEINFGFYIFSTVIISYLIYHYVVPFVSRYLNFNKESKISLVLLFYLFFMFYLIYFYNIKTELFFNIMFNIVFDIVLIFIFFREKRKKQNFKGDFSL
ncbi:MAG: hypothetical protein B1H07_01525 [Campylobacteraceae bacterium 4484_166]|nr:MAG: hypothetical protein B1H07_01525 [Campylobacteraceae bacterium 4484_166]